jgi:YD repeat-containing protein
VVALVVDTTRGQLHRQWGSAVIPQEYAYDTLGRRTQLRTWATGEDWADATWPSSPPSSPLDTTWTYHEPTGLLLSKGDAAEASTTLAYTDAGQLASRTLPTGIVISQGYDADTGELLTTTFANDSDRTPDLTYTYTRAGLSATVTDCTGTRSFAYDSALQRTSETLGSAFNGREMDYSYDSAGRRTALSTGTGGQAYAVGYSYDSASRRLTDIGYGDHTINYAYLANSHLIETTSWAYETSAVMQRFQQYDALSRLEVSWYQDSGNAVSAVSSYGFDAASRRTSNHLADGSYWS